MNKINNNQIVRVTTTTIHNNGGEVEEKAVDLISVTSSEFKDDDTKSFDEGRLQEWNFAEFSMQLMGISAGIFLLFACCVQTSWGINEYLKLITDEEKQWNETEATGYEIVDELFSSESVVVTTVIISWNIGAIIGGVVGAFIVPVLTNKIIYSFGTSLIVLSGVSMMKNGSLYYFIKGRLLLGIAFGLVQLTVIVQAAETTTKKVRRVILIIVTYMCAISTIISTVLVYKYEDTDIITYSKESKVTTIIAYFVIITAIIAMLINTILTHDTIPFLLSRGDDTKAFKLLQQFKVQHLSMIDIRYEFERIRFDVIQEELHMNRSIRAKVNYVPLTTMCGIRILNLLFTNIPITILLVWQEKKDTTNAAQNEVYVTPLASLLLLQCFRLFLGLLLTISSKKYQFNRFNYKLSFLCGISLVLSYVIYLLVGSFYVVMNTVYFPIAIIITISFLILPIPLDTIQYCQSADSYSRVKNTWALAFAIFVEHFLHLMLIVQMDMFFDLEAAFLIIGAAMVYFSWWLLKNMPNIAAIHPITVAILSRYPFKRVEHVESVHI